MRGPFACCCGVDVLAKLLQDLSIGPAAGANSEIEDRENDVWGPAQQAGSNSDTQVQSGTAQTISDPIDMIRAAFTSLLAGSLVHLFSNKHISSDSAAPPDVNWPIYGPSIRLLGFVP